MLRYSAAYGEIQIMQRRTFVSGGMFAGAGLALPRLAHSALAVAERIWTGGPILTMNDRAMRGEAVAGIGFLTALIKTQLWSEGPAAAA